MFTVMCPEPHAALGAQLAPFQHCDRLGKLVQLEPPKIYTPFGRSDIVHVCLVMADFPQLNCLTAYKTTDSKSWYDVWLGNFVPAFLQFAFGT